MHVKRFALAGAVGIALGVQNALLPTLRNKRVWLADRQRTLVGKLMARRQATPAQNLAGPLYTSAWPASPKRSRDCRWEDYSDLPIEVQQSGGVEVGTAFLSAAHAPTTFKPAA